MTDRRKWTHSLFALALLAVFVSAGALLAGNNGKKPPKDDPPPDDPPTEITISYTMTLLGTLGGSTSSVTAINEQGDVVGKSQMADGTKEIFVYFNNSGTMHRLRDLVTPTDQLDWSWTSNTAHGINSQGQICMWLQRTNPYASHAVRISLVFDEETGVVIPGQAAVEIVAPDPSYATGINENGDVTGEYLYSVAFVYDTDGYREIGDLGGGYAHPAAINNLGQVPGTSENADGDVRAFLYTPGFGMEDLGIIKTWKDRFKADDSFGRDLNDSGVVVGDAAAGNQKGLHANHAFSEAGEGMVDLGTLGGGLDSAAFSINATGDVIVRGNDEDGQERSFLYTDDFGMLDLEPLITNLPANIQITARQINDAGEICGRIIYTDGTAEAFVLTPN
jgi:probable HAF family extracellular repeat protein